MNRFIKDKKKLILIISAITTVLVLILVNLTSSTTSKRAVEFSSRNDNITYVNINIKAILRDESKVTETYNANLIEQNYITQAQIDTTITITPDMIFDDDTKFGNITSVDVKNSDDDSSIAIDETDPRAATITATNGQFDYEIVWDVAAGTNKFTIEFYDSENVQIHEPIEVTQDTEGNPIRYNQDISLDDYIPAENEFDGFAFMGWQIEGEALRSNLSDSYLGTTFTMGTQDLKFVAVFDGADTTYTVNFWKQNADGDQQLRDPDNYTLIDLGSDADPISAKVGDTLSVEELRRTGNYIVEKNDGGVGDTSNTFYGYKLGYIYLGDSEITEESITVTDGMEINYYVVKMLCVLTTTGDVGIETTTPVNQSLEFGTTVTINATTKEGYSWKHWIDQATSSVFTKSQEFTFAMNSASVNLIALAEPTEYTITLDLDGGTAAWTTKKYNIESADIALPTPRKQGYTFAGWTGDGITEPQTSYSVPTGSTGNKTFRANWTAAETTYRVVHYQQKVDGDPTKTSTQAEINANFDRAGISEYTGTTGEEVTGIPNYYPGFNTPEQQKITLTGNANTDVINYFYTRKNITISVRPDAGIMDIEGIQDSYIFGEQISFEATVKPGYEFDTWTGIDGADTENGLDNTTLTFHVPDYNVEIEAKTIAGQYSIEYDLDGGTLATPNPTTYHVGESFRINNPTKEGYEFGGWTGTDLTKPTKELYITNSTYGDKSYTATWLEIGDYSYQVNYWLENANADASIHDTTNYTKSTESHMVDFTGTGTEEVTENPIDIDGYATPDSITKVVSSTSITFDFYYERNTYVLAVKPDDPDAFTSVLGSDTYAWGDTVNIEAKTVYRHIFERWDGVDDIEDFTESALSTESDAVATFTMPAKNFTITAISAEGAPIYDYSIKYWFQKAGGGDEPNSINFELNNEYTKNATAEADTPVTVTPEEIEYYEPLNESVTVTISEDGQDVNLYYLRTKYAASFEENVAHGLDPETLMFRWGYEITIGVKIEGTDQYNPNCKGFKQIAGETVEGTLNENPMTFTMPKGNISFRTIWEEDLPDENEVPENNTNQAGTNEANEVVANDTNETPANETNEVPVNEANEIPANDTNEIATNDTNEIPANDTNEIPTNETNELPTNDIKPDNRTSGGNALPENQTGGGSGGSGSGSGSGGGSSYGYNITTGNITDGDSTTSKGKLPQTGISNATLGAMISIIIALGIGTFILTKKNKDVK